MNAFKYIDRPSTELFGAKEINLVLEGFDTIIEISRHAIQKQTHRAIYESSIITMIEEAFPSLFGIQDNERFIITSFEFGISVIGSVYQDYGSLFIDIITVIDSITPTNPYNTFVIELGEELA